MTDIDDRWYRTVNGRKVPSARHGKGKRWDARWRDGTGKPRHKAFERKLDAERFLAGLKAGLLRGIYIDPRQGKITLRSYAEQRWLPAQVHLRPNSASRYAAAVANHIVPVLGDRPLGALRRPDCTAFVAALAAKLAPSTVHTVYAVLRSLMQSAVGDQLIPANPCSRVALPRLDKPVVVPRGQGGEAPGGHQVPRPKALLRQHADPCRAAPHGHPGTPRHATIAEAMDTYGHLFPDASEQGRGALDAMFAPADVRPMCARK